MFSHYLEKRSLLAGPQRATHNQGRNYDDNDDKLSSTRRKAKN